MRCFYVPKEQILDSKIQIFGSELHHLVDVLRLKNGDEITVLDGEGGVYDAILTDISKRPPIAIGEIKSQKQIQRPSLEVTIIQGITKSDSMDMIVQKATELGVYGIIPVGCHHSVPNLTADRSQKRVTRWRQIAIEASKQSRRSFFPLISEIKDFQDALIESNVDLRLIFVAPSMASFPTQCLKKVLQKTTANISDFRSSKSIQIIIGPEGDFTEGEVSYALSKGAIPVSLGENILRTETATISALAIVLYERKD
jgi:16S rRNA (uracil1498-N3)-methyltransferase